MCYYIYYKKCVKLLYTKLVRCLSSRLLFMIQYASNPEHFHFRRDCIMYIHQHNLSVVPGGEVLPPPPTSQVTLFQATVLYSKGLQFYTFLTFQWDSKGE